MAAPKRTPFQREADLERITTYYLKGWRQAAIAAELNLAQSQVSYDLKTIQTRWRASTTINLDEAKQKELSRVDLLELEYWAAWESSKTERTKARQESDGTRDKDNKPVVKKSSMEKEARDGNPAFLAGVMSCIDRRCKLLGLDAATRNEISGPGGGPIKTEQSTKPDLAKLTADELRQMRAMVLKATDGTAND
jgi:hypothetical protein